MKKVLVTGGAGFIGSNLVRMLVDEYGCNVTVLDNMLTGRQENLKNLGIWKEIEFIEGNVEDADLLHKIFEGKDTIFHLAAVTMLPSMEKPREDMQTNIIGTFNVLDAALKMGIERVVYSSTSSVYGNPESLPVKENDGLSFLSFYSASKYAGESYTQVFHYQYGLPVTTVRYSNVYGMNQRPENPYTGVIARFIDWALNDEPLRVYGDGNQTRDFTFIEDACRATIQSAISEKAVGETYNIGTGLETSINDLAHFIIRLTGSNSSIIFEGKRNIDSIFRRVLNTKKAEKELKFRSQWFLSDGLEETIVWIRKGRRNLL